MATTLDLPSTARALVSAPRNRRFLAFLPAPLVWLSKRLVTCRATGGRRCRESGETSSLQRLRPHGHFRMGA